MPGEVLIGEPTATIEAYTTAALGASKKIAPTCSFLASKTGTVEAIRWWNAETAAATAVGVGIYADNGSATAPTGLSPVNKAGAALAEGAGTGLVLTAKTWTQVTLGTPLKVTKGVRYWIGLNDIGAGTAVKPATAVSGTTGTLTLKNSNNLTENFRGAEETWVEQSKKGPLGIQALGTEEGEEGKLAGTARVKIGASCAIVATAAVAGTPKVKISAAAALHSEAGGTEQTISGRASVKIGATAALVAKAVLSGKAAVKIAANAGIGTPEALYLVAQAAISGKAPTTITATDALAANATLAGKSAVKVTTTAHLAAGAGLVGKVTVKVTATGRLAAGARLSGQVAVVVESTSSLGAWAGLHGTATVRIGASGKIIAGAEPSPHGLITIKNQRQALITIESE